MTSKLTIKQLDLLHKIYKPFQLKYHTLSLDTFVLKFTNKTIDELLGKDLFFLIQKVNSGYDYWDITTDNIFLKPNFNKITYIIKKETNDYIIGTQLNYNDYLKSSLNYSLEIIAFKHLMILDYDLNVDQTKEQLLSYVIDILSNSPYTFLIYETTNGYHAYNISQKFHYFNNNTLKIMHNLKCDKWYINFTKYIGFVTRLQKKQNRNEAFIEKFITYINKHLQHCPLLKKLVEFKDSLLKNI